MEHDEHIGWNAGWNAAFRIGAYTILGLSIGTVFAFVKQVLNMPI